MQELTKGESTPHDPGRVTGPERAHSLFRHAHDGIAYAGLDGRLLEVNDAFTRLTGHDHAQLLEMTHQGLTPPEYHDTEARLVRSLLATGTSITYEKEYIRKDGERIPVWICAFVVRADDGRSLGLGAIVRDLSERRATEQALRHIQRIESLRVLARGVSHDFNNVLGTVVGHLTLAQQGLPDESPIHDHMTRARLAVRRAAALVDQLVLYAGSGEYRPEPTDVNALLEDLRPILTVALSDKGRLRFELGPDLALLPVDRLQMQQLLTQLVTNAAEAMPQDGGVVTIRTGVHEVTSAERARWSRTGMVLHEGRYAMIKVEDDGCGVNAETLPRVFDPFYSTKFVGRGLGLATVLGVARAHHGSIDIESEPARGTKLTVLLPFEVRSRAYFTGTAAARTGSILVVEDEPDILNFASHVLRTAGFTVLTAPDGAAGMDVFRAHKDDIRLVVLDFSMPKMGGGEMVRQIRALMPTVHVLLTSGYNTYDATATFEPGELTGFLHKPYDGEILIAKVLECLPRP